MKTFGMFCSFFSFSEPGYCASFLSKFCVSTLKAANKNIIEDTSLYHVEHFL
ncbi:hypothetical protein PAHAL_6G157500 [Panicum hallii]|uniref:Uncharacterized protein n=1 Tax=Panicum hallii TaxID=206008 RepID=A0A2T8IGF0_9POAL|nr:hypothetical protein PAHAL_6G157500 [Panicum hallii]